MSDISIVSLGAFKYFRPPLQPIFLMKEILIILLAYLIGSLPTAVWVSKYFFKIDIREYGSGNAGATNTFRVLGKKWGTFVMVADMLKGLVAVKLVWLIPYYFDHDLARTSLQI